MENASFLYLADSIRNPDDRQNAYLILLEKRPETKREAEALLSKLHHRSEWDRRQERKRTIPLVFDPVAPQQDPHDGRMVAALDRLSKPDRELIESHIIDELTLREIATQSGLSKDAIRKRYNVAARKLMELFK